MADPAFYSLGAEDEQKRATAPPYVPIVDRDDRYPQRRPLGVDRYRIAFDKPVVVPRSFDPKDLNESANAKFLRLGDEAKISFAFAPTDNMKPFNFAAAFGHPSGAPGVTGEMITDEQNPELGGGFMLPHLVHATNVDRLVPMPSMRL